MPAWAKTQIKRDSSEKVNKTTIDLVYNQYIQSGKNSAVTGGIGTEQLYVYGPAATIKRTKHLHAYTFNGGVDIITSASTDNIDFVPSSASRIDMRGYINVGYEKQLPQHEISLYGAGGMSMESDYFSMNGKVSFNKESADKLKGWSAEFQLFADDMRWGRLNPNYFKPVTIVYPYELRYKQWYQEYM